MFYNDNYFLLFDSSLSQTFSFPTPLFWILYFLTGFMDAGPLMAERQVLPQWKALEMSQIHVWPSSNVRLLWGLFSVVNSPPSHTPACVAVTSPGIPLPQPVACGGIGFSFVPSFH